MPLNPHSNHRHQHLLTSLLFLLTTTILTLSPPAHASPFSDNTTSLLDARQTGCIPAAESCDGGKTCCTGLFCSLTAPHTCSKCIGSAGFCRGVPCCDGLFCGLSTATCGPCIPAGRAGCMDHPCCLGSLCGSDDFCH